MFLHVSPIYKSWFSTKNGHKFIKFSHILDIIMEEEEAAQVHLLTDTKMLQTLCTLVLDAEWLEFHLDLTDTENWGEF